MFLGGFSWRKLREERLFAHKKSRAPAGEPAYAGYDLRTNINSRAYAPPAGALRKQVIKDALRPRRAHRPHRGDRL